VRAFYAWDGGRGCLFWHSTRLIQRDLRAFLTANPGADLIFIGHSYGGSAIMDVLRHLNAPHGRVLVATLDPVSCRERSHPRERAEGVDYWVNAYCRPYRHFKDLAASIGGPWRECPQADVNIVFSGDERDDSGRRYQHAQPGPLFQERAPGQNHSAHELLISAAKRLITGRASSQTTTTSKP
jgi:pimeloyl-ACP methyl ester carboxylesterase